MGIKHWYTNFMKIECEAVSSKNIQIITNWFANDAVGVRWLAFYKDAKKWQSLLNEASRWGWIIYKNTSPIGFIDLEKVRETGYFAYYVAQAFRGQSLSSIVLRQLEQFAQERDIKIVRGEFEDENSASDAALSKNNYSLRVSTTIGMVEASKKLN